MALITIYPGRIINSDDVLEMDLVTRNGITFARYWMRAGNVHTVVNDERRPTVAEDSYRAMRTAKRGY